MGVAMYIGAHGGGHDVDDSFDQLGLLHVGHGLVAAHELVGVEVSPLWSRGIAAETSRSDIRSLREGDRVSARIIPDRDRYARTGLVTCCRAE